jgi:hypothetical protein
MTLITFQDGKPVLRDGKVGTEQACCCQCGRCIIDGEWDCRYATKAQCEECTTTYYCENLETADVTVVDDCSECVGENVYCYSTIEGPCGTWEPNAPCEPCPCEENADCPEGQSCCDGICREPICPDVKYYHIVFHIPAVPGPAGTSKVCQSNLDQLLLDPCGMAGISRSVSYGPFFNCGLTVSAEIGAGCILQNIVVTQTSGPDCNDNKPEFVEIVEIEQADCETVFIPD